MYVVYFRNVVIYACILVMKRCDDIYVISND